METSLDAIAQAEVLKSEGNGHFKQQQYGRAARAYTAALERLGAAADTSAAKHVEAAVRLNRAWALLEAGDSDEKSLRLAERDCSEVLVMDANCVKAFYRRALAKERLGDYAGAKEDTLRMKALEPTNPFAEPILQRLEPLVSTGASASKAVNRAEDAELTLAAKMDRVSIAESSIEAKQSRPTEQKTPNVDADAVWRALQEEERCLRRAHKATAPKQPQRRPRSVNTKATTAPISHDGGEISKKTDALWALLGEEEASTVAKAFSHSTKPKRASTPH